MAEFRGETASCRNLSGSVRGKCFSCAARRPAKGATHHGEKHRRREFAVLVLGVVFRSKLLSYIILSSFNGGASGVIN